MTDLRARPAQRGAGTTMIRLALALALALALVAGCAAPGPRERCYEGRRAADVAADLRRSFAIEPHPIVAGRFTVRARGVAGKLEEGVPSCAGARLSLWPVAEGGTSRRAGPLGPRATRIPHEP